jgi:hypothetical protein
MDEKILQKFILERSIKTSFFKNSSTRFSLLVWFSNYDLQSLSDIIIDKYFNSFESNGFDIQFQRYSFVIDLYPICKFFNIEPESILK